MLQNEYLPVRIGFDTAEEEPAKIRQHLAQPAVQRAVQLYFLDFPRRALGAPLLAVDLSSKQFRGCLSKEDRASGRWWWGVDVQLQRQISESSQCSKHCLEI